MLIKCLLQDAWLGLPGIGCANFARGKKCPSRNYGPHHGGLNHSLGHLTLVSLLRKHLEAESWNPRKESVFYRKDHLMPEYQLGLFLLKWPSRTFVTKTANHSFWRFSDAQTSNRHWRAMRMRRHVLWDFKESFLASTVAQRWHGTLLRSSAILAHFHP